MKQYNDQDIYDIFFKATYATRAEIYQRFNSDEFNDLSDDSKGFLNLVMSLIEDIYLKEIQNTLKGIYNTKD